MNERPNKTLKLCNNFWKKVKQYEVSESTDYMYEICEFFLESGDYETCNEILKSADFDNLSSFNIRSILVVMYPARKRLTSWHESYKKAYNAMTKLKGKEEAQKLLGFLV